MKEFDSESLRLFNGKDGNEIYVAYKGKVFDVSASKLWKSGMHMKRHEAGRDLSQDILAAPHGPETLERFSQIGVLKQTEEPENKLPVFLNRMFEAFPFLQRHPHPVLVHFPIAFLTAPAIFTVLFFITGVKEFETTAFDCLGFGVLTAIPAAVSGYFTWWLNYQAKPMHAVKIKIYLSLLLFIISVPAFILRLAHPDVLFSACKMMCEDIFLRSFC